jgi:hypothetical protein
MHELEIPDEGDLVTYTTGPYSADLWDHHDSAKVSRDREGQFCRLLQLEMQTAALGLAAKVLYKVL